MRNAVALQHGATEELLAQVDSYESSDLPEDQKLLLRLTDAFLSSPSEVSAQLQEELSEHFTAAQIVDLLLHLIQWSRDKAMVALSLELDEVRHQIY
jgi:alkylhydroperoxidase family enzyme